MAIDNNTSIGIHENESSLALIPEDFDNYGIIPEAYFYNNENQLPSFMVDGVPDSVKSLAFIMIDEDSPGQNTVHWIMWDIDPKVTRLDEQSGTVGKNSWHNNSYHGPTPLKKRNHYQFNLYGLPSNISLDEAADLDQVISMIKQNAITSTSVTGIVESTGEFAIE